MKNSVLALFGIGAACAACCLPLVAPLLAGTGLSGILAFRLAGISADYLVCVIVPWAVLGGLIALLAYSAWTKSRHVCACKTACDPATCKPALGE